ncbi:hypothetical protein BC830DRAFT_1080301 [Chytriomyces sp. MP71]|nr:hypothetical protein BC830DRAFT_1080301 [Chytriomyces sp. MP71]
MGDCKTAYLCKQPASPLVLLHERSLNKVIITAGNPTASEQSVLADSCNAIVSYFSQAKVSPNRLLYIAISRVFDLQSPRPFGGQKSRPGYAEYKGKSAHSLLEYTVTMCFKWYWGCRGPEALQFTVESMNLALEMHHKHDRDYLNEVTLKGMRRAGHIDWVKAAFLPYALRDEAERERSAELRAAEVRFTPQRWYISFSPYH